MFYVKMQNGLPLEIRESFPAELKLGEWVTKDWQWQSRNDWTSFEEVSTLARYATAMTGKMFLPVDRSEHCSPRFDLTIAPKIGDAVSCAFNGDSYPDGHIVKITKALQVTTSTGNKYRRLQNSDIWLRVGGTWSLVMGHHYTQNPHF